MSGWVTRTSQPTLIYTTNSGQEVLSNNKDQERVLNIFLSLKEVLTEANAETRGGVSVIVCCKPESYQAGGCILITATKLLQIALSRRFRCKQSEEIPGIMTLAT